MFSGPPFFGILSAMDIQKVIKTPRGMAVSVSFLSFIMYCDRTGLPLQTTFSPGR
jgi:hypothetical protein